MQANILFTSTLPPTLTCPLSPSSTCFLPPTSLAPSHPPCYFTTPIYKDKVSDLILTIKTILSNKIESKLPQCAALNFFKIPSSKKAKLESILDEKKSKRGGGAGVFIKHDIKYVVNDNSAFDDENVDVLCVDIESGHASSRGVLKNRLYKIAVAAPNSANVEKYKKFRNYFTSVKRKAEKNYFQQKFEEAKSCSKQKWEIINGIMNREQNILEINKLKVDDKIIEDPEEISILFNEYFINGTEKLVFKNLHPHCHTSEYYLEMKILNIKNLFIYHVATFIFRFLRQQFLETFSLLELPFKQELHATFPCSTSQN
ncbi:hypothetical protein HELRODRAFT_180102 [Helobdella robusta]|uniref:Uncharacterized protein n=1 Tax=Helobdella robusta TaxID=6412 RepID=T1FFH3_HELRO|nr:hypothetical protein HELRODRAFT_180102 [Helobdella robusta]ESN94770.1 hypothetical protein HELRODRAFT_180102 [Helobdella robusta]